MLDIIDPVDNIDIFFVGPKIVVEARKSNEQH